MEPQANNIGIRTLLDQLGILYNKGYDFVNVVILSPTKVGLQAVKLLPSSTKPPTRPLSGRDDLKQNIL